MKNISIIAAVGKNQELGKDNKLLWHIKEDMEFFKEKTINKNVIMCIYTFYSLPKKLPNRKHIVLTHKDLKLDDDIIIMHNLKETLEYIKTKQKEFMIIGGAKIYQEFIDFADKMYLTHIKDTKEADTYFPKINEDEWNNFILSSFCEPLEYTHNKYVRKKNFKY